MQSTPVVIRPRASRVLVGTAVLIFMASLFAPVMEHVFGFGSVKGLSRLSTQLFHVDLESNVAAWFSSAILMTAAVLLALVGLTKRAARDRYAVHWLGLSVLFVFLSMDETAMFHERTIDPLRNLLGAAATGVLYYTWVVLGALLVGVVAIIYFNFLRDLPPPIRARFLVAGGLFVSGALGVEMIGAYSDYAHGPGYGRTITRHFLTHVEEGLEVAGVILFIHAILLYHSRFVGATLLVIGDHGHHPRKKMGARLPPIPTGLAGTAAAPPSDPVPSRPEGG